MNGRQLGDRRTAIAGIVVFVVVCAAVFADLDFLFPKFELKARVTAATQLRPGNPVRVAGVDVGEVTGVSGGAGATSIIEMRVGAAGLPVHSDASARIEPRLALEGNNYVRLDPGSQHSPELESGSTIPIEQTAGSVQVDQVLGVFDSPTRAALQTGFAALAEGLGPEGSRKSGSRSLREATGELSGALNGVTRVARAAHGRTQGDLGRAVADMSEVAEQLSADPDSLAGIPANVNRLSSAVTASENALGRTMVALDTDLRRAPSALAAVDSAAPRLESFALDLKPVLEQGRTALPPVNRLVEQVNRASGAGELPRLVSELGPLTHRLPSFESQLTEALPYAGRIGSCLHTQIVPALAQEVPDRKLSTGRPAYQDVVHAFTNLSAANPSFDANGRILRVVAAGGEKTLTALLPPFGKLVAGTAPDIQGVSPVWLGPGVEPSWEPGADCRDQKLPDLTARRNTGPLAGVTEAPSTSSVSRPRATTGDVVGAALDDLRTAIRKGTR